MKKVISLLAFAAAITYSCVQNKQVGVNSSDVAASNERDPETIYTEFCSSCHGQKVAAFVDRKWKHGKTKSELIASITNGYVDNGMPSWKSTFTAGEIDAMATLIVENLATVSQYDFKEKPRQEVYQINGQSVKLQAVAEELDVPWGMVVLPNGNLLVSDRNGDVLLINDKKEKTKVRNVPNVLSQGQGGMLDIALHPNFAQNSLVYFSFSKFKKADGKDLSTTAVVRGKLINDVIVGPEEIFEALPYSTTRHHYGSRMVFDKDGYLYVSVGDRGNHDKNPQNLDNTCGKINRIKDDGSIPSDNPFVNESGAKGSIWSYGHRNPQGLVYNPTTNKIWETEHGPRGGDEVNIIQKGKNYGWPVISYGINYDGTTFTSLTAKEGMEQPEIYWIPSIAPSGLTFVNSDKYPSWKGDLLAGSLRFNYINRCVIKNEKIVKEEKILLNIGRVRNIIQGSDGYIYVSVEDPGTIYKLLPL